MGKDSHEQLSSLPVSLLLGEGEGKILLDELSSKVRMLGSLDPLVDRAVQAVFAAIVHHCPGLLELCAAYLEAPRFSRLESQDLILSESMPSEVTLDAAPAELVAPEGDVFDPKDEPVADRGAFNIDSKKSHPISAPPSTTAPTFSFLPKRNTPSEPTPRSSSEGSSAEALPRPILIAFRRANAIRPTLLRLRQQTKTHLVDADGGDSGDGLPGQHQASRMNRHIQNAILRAMFLLELEPSDGMSVNELSSSSDMEALIDHVIEVGKQVCLGVNW